MRNCVLILAAALFITPTVTASAQKHMSQKDECLLSSKNCLNQVDDIYMRMHRLNKAIKEGKRVYTTEELRRLHEKLTETQNLLKQLEQPGH